MRSPAADTPPRRWHTGRVSDATKQTRYITCVLCEASCGLEVVTDGPAVVSIRGHEADPLSRGHICPKAIALQDIHTDPDRLRTPVRRVGEPGADATWEPIGWDEAFDLVAEKIVATQKAHGPDAVAVYQGNPNVHSLGALTHGVSLVRTIKSRNTFSATSVDQLPHQLIAMLLYGHQFLLPVPDIDRTDLLVLVGNNPMASNGSIMTVPDFAGRLRELKARGGRLVVIDPRRTETAKVADAHHFVRPGTDAYVLLAILQVLTSEGLTAPAQYVDGLAELSAAVAAFTPERAEAVSGMPANTIRDLARDLARGTAAIHGRMGVSTQAHGAICQFACQAINIVTGNLDRPGGTMFTTPAIDLIGKKMLGKGHLGAWTSRVRGLPEFGGELPVSVLAEEITTDGAGQIKTLVCIAGNPVSSTPAGDALGAALARLDFMVAIDFYIGETSRYADVILPPTGPLERDHYDLVFHLLAVRNTARWSSALFDKPDDARHDWEIAKELALRIIALRHAEDTGDGVIGAAARALNAVKDLPAVVEAQARFRTSPKQQIDLALKAFRTGLSVKSLGETPGGVDLGPLEPRLPARLLTDDKRIDLDQRLLLGAIAHLAASSDPQLAPEELLLIGRRAQRDNNSWLHNAERLTTGRARHRLLIHPDDAAARDLTDGAVTKVTSATGEIRVECQISDDVMPGVVCLPHGYGHAANAGIRLRHAKTLPGASYNDLTDPGRLDSVSGNAVLNGIPVRVFTDAGATP